MSASNGIISLETTGTDNHGLEIRTITNEMRPINLGLATAKRIECTGPVGMVATRDTDIATATSMTSS